MSVVKVMTDVTASHSASTSLGLTSASVPQRVMLGGIVKVS